MFRTILTYGLLAGLVVAAPMFSLLAVGEPGTASHSVITGYTLMILAFSLIFVAVKRHRDRVLGGVIRFVPALLIGLAISAVAGVVYVIGWEITLALTDYAFVKSYVAAGVSDAQARGLPPEELAKVVAGIESYANPLVRMPLSFLVEIFPVGAFISIVSAALLRNSRFLPARSPSPA